MPEAFVRETKRRLLSLIHNAEYRIERKRMSEILSIYDPSPIKNPVPKKAETIAFVVTRMVRFHGGQTSVLRLGTQLEKHGMKVWYLSRKPQSREEMQICASSNLTGYKGTVMPLADFEAAVENGELEEPDFVSATSWDTVSIVKRFKNACKVYFVQDYEPYFYKFGEEFLMAKATYEQGLHMISLGEWNRNMIERECRPVSRTDAVSFPCEKSEYPRVKRDYSSYPAKKKITLAVYVKFYGKRLPNLIPYMLQNTTQKLKESGIELEVLYFGEAKTFKAAGGKNLGQLDKNALRELYGKADFGMVASMSNISLVPYEMHSAGLPVIEFSEGTYTEFFKEKSAFLTDMGQSDIAGLLLDAIADPGQLDRMQRLADAQMEALSWERTGREFYEILRNLCISSGKTEEGLKAGRELPRE